MKYPIHIAGVLSVIAGWPGVAADDSGDVTVNPENQLQLRRCIVAYAESAQLGAPEVGIIEESYVVRGTEVKAGQLLAKMPDGELRAQLEELKYTAASDVEVRLAQLHYKRALNRLHIDTVLKARGAIGPEQVFTDQIEVELAAVTVEQAKERKLIARLRYNEGLGHLRTKQIISPYNGVVSAVLKRPGESIMIGDPVYRVDNIERLQVTGRVDISEVWRVKVGASMSMRIDVDGVDLPIEQQKFVGVVTFIDTMVDTATQTCAVVCTAANNDRLQVAGMEATIFINLQPTAVVGK